MRARKTTRRVRPRLLILLWIWVISVAIVLDMFWNVEEFDGLRPRHRLYRGMRVAGHKMVGVPVEEGHDQARFPESVRAMVTFCQRADYDDVRALTNMALTAKDPLAACNAIGALGRLGVAGGDPELVALLSDARKRVRRETIVALGKSGQPSSIQALEPLLEDGDASVRLLAIRAIGDIGGRRATELLRGVLERPGRTQIERALARAALH